MPTPAYTEHEAAIHELGHAMIACALGLQFQHVRIRPANAPRVGWEGQCLLVAGQPGLRRATVDAFQLGGPLLQIAVDPGSVGAHLGIFQPSLFSNPARCMDPNDAFAIANLDLGWASDLFQTGMMHEAAGWPPYAMGSKGFGGPKPWVPGLEAVVRALLGRCEVVAVATALQPELAQQKQLPAQAVLGAYNAGVGPAAAQPLATYLAAQPP